MSDPLLSETCPGCDDEAIGQRQDSDGLVYWVAKGWSDPYPNEGTGRDRAIDYCPFCGQELEESVEILPLPAREVGQA